MAPEWKSNLKIPSCAQNVAEVLVPKEIKFSAPTPLWLLGTLWLSGPGTFDLQLGSFKGLMDGLAITTKLEIGPDSIKISSKYVQTLSFKKAIKAKQPVSPALMTPPGPDSRGFFSKLLPFTIQDITDNCIGVVTKLDSKFYVFADGPIIHEINPKTLSTLDHFNTQKMFGLNSICPEIKKDIRTGDLYICGSTIKPTFHNIIVKMPFSDIHKGLEEKFHFLGSIPSRWKFGPCGLKQSFALTENYVVFIESPYIVNIMRCAATYLKHYRMADWMDWIPGDRTKFYLMHKSTGKVLKADYLTSEGVVCFDIVNAYEEGDKIILDICTQSDMSILEGFNLSYIRSLISPKNYTPSYMKRFVIPIIQDSRRPSMMRRRSSDARGSSIRKTIITGEVINQNCRGSDFAVINPNYSSRKHSFTYVTSCLPSTLSNMSQIANGIAKVYANDGHERLMWEAGAGFHPWKPVFIPNPTGSTEDDGVLISVVSNLQKRQGEFLVVIDAATMKEISRVEFKDCPIASYYLPTFHFK